MKIFLALAFLFLQGCATIVNGPSSQVAIESFPSGADFTITDRNGNFVQHGTTPALVTLSNGSSYFVGENYSITYFKDNFKSANNTLHSNLTPWYFGNLIFGGIVIGMLIVDPITGSMWSLPNSSKQILIQNQ